MKAMHIASIELLKPILMLAKTKKIISPKPIPLLLVNNITTRKNMRLNTIPLQISSSIMFPDDNIFKIE